MLKVLFLVSRDIRHPANTGGDLFLWGQAAYLAREGYEVTLMASGFPGADAQESIDGVRVYRAGGLLSLWWRTFLFYMTKARGKFDVVVAEGFGGSRIPRFTPLYVKEPIITEWHQIHADLFAVQYPKLFRPFLNLLERLTAFVHRNTIVMARTSDWRDRFPSIGFKPGKIRVVPVCIDEEWLLNSARRPDIGPQIIWLGKFRRYKCPDHLIRAMAQVAERVPESRLILAGFHDDGRYEDELRRLVDQLGLGNVVDFRFNITNEEKRLLLDSSRVLVVPSSVEGFGIVVLEANARGVPVIASTGVPIGAVQDGLNGLRYEFGDIDALAENIIRLTSNDNLHAEIAATALAFARKFGCRRISREYESVIKEVAPRARIGSGSLV